MQKDGNSKKNKKAMLEIKNTEIEMRNAFDGLINRIDKAEEGISELENISVETYLKKK